MDEKQIKSVNLYKSKVEKINNYIAQNGGYFGDVVDRGIDLFFESLENGNNKIIESIGLEDPDNTILVPLQLYLKLKNISHTQAKNLEKKKKIMVKTYNESGINGKSSKNRYVAICEKNPEYYQAKIALVENTVSNLQDQINELTEKVRKSAL